MANQNHFSSLNNTSTSFSRLRAALKGRVITPTDSEYDEARTVFYRGIKRRPAIIIKVADETDILRVVLFARETGIELAVRSGGHSRAGHGTSDGGIVLDLSEMKALDIDIEKRTAWAQTGLTAEEYTAKVGAYGLATGFGDTGSVGIGGITLGGGLGFLVRKYGLTIDDLLAAEIVTADGRILCVDSETYPELFWAIRGGGGNFGVVTRFLFRLHKLDIILGGMLMLPATPDAIASLIAEAETAPEELSIIVNILQVPSMPLVPTEHQGRPVIMALLAYAGEVGEGERVIAPFRKLATPIADTVQPMHYSEIYKLTEGGPQITEEASHSMFIDSIDLSKAEVIADYLKASTAQLAAAQLRVLGGAMARVPVDATAFAHRERRVMTTLIAVYERPEETIVHETWVTAFAKALNQNAPGVYVNFLGNESKERVHEAYPGSTWDTLRSIKRLYDPTNLFRLNQNIPPALLCSTRAEKNR